MKVAALVSGGVDSSLALKLIKDAGHEVVAFYLKIWLEDELTTLGDCPWEEDLSYVKKVCKQLNVPLKVINLQDAYHKKIVSYTIKEVAAGRTPNPDVLCNQHIKFGTFLEHIDDSFDKVASGHYAQIIDGKLKRAPDPVKDQTYFLCNLDDKQLSRLMFPIGHLNKGEVRELAQKYYLPNKNRKDSQGICFLGKFKFRDFLKHHLGEKEGPLVEFETNKPLGVHHGHWFYTVGQRRDIRISHGPWYVVKKDPTTNTVYVSNHYDDITDEKKSFEVTDIHWLNKKRDLGGISVRVRHRTVEPKKCSIDALDDNTWRVTLEKSDQGIASGQFAVFYDGDTCIASGVIK